MIDERFKEKIDLSNEAEAYNVVTSKVFFLFNTTSHTQMELGSQSIG